MTSAASPPASASQAATPTSVPANAAIARLQATEPLGPRELVTKPASPVAELAVRPRSWAVVVSDCMTSPVRSELYRAAWVSRGRNNAHKPAGIDANGELMLHQSLAPGVFLRLSLGVAYQPRLTGASGGSAAVGLSLVRPFD